MDGTVLVADDDRTIRTVLTQALTRAGCKVHATASLMTLLRWVEEGRGDLVISDVIMPDGNGLDALPRIGTLRPGLPVIVISAQNTIMTAIQATEKDAYDYLPKPFDLPDLMKRASRALSIKKRSTKEQPVASAPQHDELPLVGRTKAMQRLYRLVARVLNSGLPVLVNGESGTGKSLIGRAIHDFSDRRTMPMVAVRGEDLEGVDGPSRIMAKVKTGSLVFEEVGDLSDEEQARVVRMLDTIPENGPRILATSQVDLLRMVEEGTFRQDLYYRLNGVTLDVPSLRERVDDIPLLTDHFLARAERDGTPERSFTDQALEVMRGFSWPGNVRQLENAVRRLVATSAEGTITEVEVRSFLGAQPAMDAVAVTAPPDKLSGSVAGHLKRYFDLHGGELPPAGLYQRILREVETPLIEIALDATAGNQAKCADLLGINRNTLRKKITELDIKVTRGRRLM